MNKEILKRIVTKAYEIGRYDGYNDLYNQEFVGSDKIYLKDLTEEENVFVEISEEFLFLTEDDMISQAKGIDIELVSGYHFINPHSIEAAAYVEFQNSNGEIKILKNRYE